MTNKEKREHQIEQLEQATREVLTSEGFQRWLVTRRTFHRYSLNNQLLIASQRPKVNGEPVADYATRVAGYRAWEKLNRQVMKGAKGIAILAPVVVEKHKDEQLELGDDEEKDVRIFYRTVYVFDVSQTKGEPLAKVPLKSIAGSSHEYLLSELREFAHGLGISVVEKDLSKRPEGGWFSERLQEIVIDATVSSNEKVRTLTHETCHALGVGYKEFGRERAEVIVEASTLIVLDTMGLDTSGVSLPYIASWGEKDGLATLRQDLKTIDTIVSKLEAYLDPSWKELQVA